LQKERKYNDKHVLQGVTIGISESEGGGGCFRGWVIVIAKYVDP
jgi:hypothetical protein